MNNSDWIHCVCFICGSMVNIGDIQNVARLLRASNEVSRVVIQNMKFMDVQRSKCMIISMYEQEYTLAPLNAELGNRRTLKCHSNSVQPYNSYHRQQHE